MGGDAIEVRDLRFELNGVPKDWLAGNRAVSIFFGNLSIFFPPGERFFVAAVKRYRNDPRVQADPELARAVEAFCAQEGHHSREHVRYNKLLAEQGYPAAALEGRVERILRRVTKFAPHRRQLGATCALEHFTSLMGGLVLSNPEMLVGAHPEMAALWRWHSAEENEHKSVAFDVFRAVGGSWFERVLTMFMATWIFWTLVGLQQLSMMRADGILFSGREWRGLLHFLFVAPWRLTSLWRAYFDYYRPSFHPDTEGTHPLLEQWRAEVARGTGR